MIINLCLAAFPWATFRQKKGAIKLHIGLDADGYLPEFIDVTEGKKHEISWARMLKLPNGSLAVFDKGFTDYEWWQELTTNGIFFVTRLKDNALVEYFKKRPGQGAMLAVVFDLLIPGVGCIHESPARLGPLSIQNSFLRQSSGFALQRSGRHYSNIGTPCIQFMHTIRQLCPGSALALCDIAVRP
jgi:hypothetical protein